MANTTEDKKIPIIESIRYNTKLITYIIILVLFALLFVNVRVISTILNYMPSSSLVTMLISVSGLDRFLFIQWKSGRKSGTHPIFYCHLFPKIGMCPYFPDIIVDQIRAVDNKRFKEHLGEISDNNKKLLLKNLRILILE